MIITTILFYLSIFFVIYLPGKFLLREAKFNFKSKVINVSVSICFGISFFLFLNYFFSFFNLSIVVFLLAFLLSFIELLHLIKNKIEIKKEFSYELFIIILGSLSMASLMFLSGSKVNNGDLQFFSINSTDAFYHLSLIGSIKNNFPPVHPGLDGIQLKGYHFFYDFLLANFSKILSFNSLDLYFRLFPFFISFFYGLSAFALSKFLKISKVSTLLFLIFIYFAQGFGYFISQYYHTDYNTGIIQGLSHIVDPNVVFSLGFLFVVFILIFSSHKLSQIIFSAIVIGVVANIKIYTAVIIFFAISVVGIVSFLKNKQSEYLKILILASIIGGIIYLPINFGAGSLIFYPFLLFIHFMESTSLFSNFDWVLKYQFYLSDGNIFRISYLLGIALIIFFIPSLGIRLLDVYYFPKLFKKSFYSYKNIFWLSAISISFIIPVLFIQNVAVFVIIQFLWIGYLLLLLPTSIVFGKILSKVNLFIKLVLFTSIILVFLPENLITFNTFTKNPIIISENIVNISNYIKKNVPKDEKIILLNREKKQSEFKDLYETPIVSALSEHAVYYEPEVLDFKLTEKIIRERKEVIDTILESSYSCDNLYLVDKIVSDQMLRTGNRYLLSFNHISCLENIKSIKKIREEGNIHLYKLL